MRNAQQNLSDLFLKPVVAYEWSLGRGDGEARGVLSLDVTN